MASGTSSPRGQTSAVVAGIGSATSGSNTSIIDSRKNWVANKWVGSQVQILKLNGNEYFCNILSNTVNQINFAALPGGIVVNAGDLYSILATNDPSGAKLIRWGRDVTPAWVHAVEVVAPLVGAVLVTQAVGAGVSGYIYGFFISVGEGNDFLLNWVSATVAYSKRLVFGAGGTVETIDQVPLNEGYPADAGSAVTIINVNAGAGGIIYQACLLYAEV